jgi:hypothetical protein
MVVFCVAADAENVLASMQARLPQCLLGGGTPSSLNVYWSRDLRSMNLCSSFLLVMRKSDQWKNEICRLLTPPTTVEWRAVIRTEDYGWKESNA